ncbi:MAG TPA: penicillin-binding transpeptidase domain-containing protein [Pyrinomonadaceae bacterium]|nr:penicillin-binding transpeptidase domain-containing protein [Pyrinomonadaceae bacterium]
MVAVFLLLWMLAVGARLAYLQTSQHEWLARRARAQQTGVETEQAVRGLILDRQGRELARSVDVDSFFADPREVEKAEETATSIARVLDLDAVSLASKLREGKEAKRGFVWLARKVDAERAKVVHDLKLKGVYSVEEQKRSYPNRSLAAHVLGYVGLDEKGLAGVEQIYDASLKGEEGRVLVDKDGKRKAFESEERAPQDGRTVVLTIDQTIQFVVERELAAAVERTHAKSAAAVVLEPHTGEVLALANAPTFDPNQAGAVSDDARRNDALQNIYEPGSTFKLVAYTAALEEKLITPETRIQCEGSISLPGRVVHDHAHGSLTATEALAKSSNVAAIKLGMRLGNERLYSYIRKLGFGSKTGVELPGETGGIVRHFSKWQPGSIGSVPIGHEVGVTPVQMAAAYAAVANDGVRVAPHLVREVRDAEGRVVERAQPEQRRVVSEETARQLRGMLESVTLKGTARAAQLQGYTAAGKTGTAQKIDERTRAYSQTDYVASFVGFAPVERPAAVIIVVMDDPEGAHQGGQVAAPVFSEIANQILPYLDVMPDTGPDAPTPNAQGQLASNTTPARIAPAQAPADASAEDKSVAVENSGLPEVAGGRAGGVGEVVYAPAAERALLMPNLRGRSVRDAAIICSRLGLELEARGDGRALRQSPEAGAAVAAGQTVRIEFGRSD